MKTASQRWIDAAVVLGKDPTAKVLCPQNEDAYLEAWDQVLGNDEGGQRFARHLRCPICGAYNEMLMRRP